MGNIYHEWNGTVLTVTSDSGTSSADLKGDMGVRGPQGIPGSGSGTGGGDVDLSGKMDKFGEVEVIEGLDEINVNLSNTTTFNSQGAIAFNATEILFLSPLTIHEAPQGDYEATNKLYVDGLVGDISTALEEIEAIQDALIGGNE